MTTFSNQNISLTIRNPENYPEYLKFVLDLITFNEVPNVIGSYRYNVQKYPGDIDLFERVVISLDVDQAAKFYEEQFKIIFQKLLVNSKKIFINDFKVGENPVLKKIYDDPELSLDNLKIREELSKLLPVEDFNKLYSPLSLS